MTQIINAYNNVVLALAGSKTYVDIPLWKIQNHLTEHLGVTKERVALVHVHRMIELGYLKEVKGGFPEQREYDLIGKKLHQIIRERVG
jgi:hypothetical protein